jgi:hypothetical protein
MVAFVSLIVQDEVADEFLTVTLEERPSPFTNKGDNARGKLTWGQKIFLRGSWRNGKAGL